MAKTIKRRKSIGSVKYTGELATPLIEFFGDDAEAQQYYGRQRLAKLGALFERYSIDPAAPDAWRLLAMSLAGDHVPGMQIRPASQKRGRPRSWANGLYPKLLRAVEEIRDKDKRCTLAEAIQILQSDGEWSGYSPENLGARHREASQIERDHRHNYREWKGKAPHVALLRALGIDDDYFESLRLAGFKIDEN